MITFYYRKVSSFDFAERPNHTLEQEKTVARAGFMNQTKLKEDTTFINQTKLKEDTTKKLKPVLVTDL